MSRLPRTAATSRSTSISHPARPDRDGIPGEGILGWPVAGRPGRAWRATQAIRHAELTRDLRNGQAGRLVTQDAGPGLAERRGGLPAPAGSSRRAGSGCGRARRDPGPARWGTGRLRRRRACRGRSPPARVLPPPDGMACRDGASDDGRERATAAAYRSSPSSRSAAMTVRMTGGWRSWSSISARAASLAATAVWRASRTLPLRGSPRPRPPPLYAQNDNSEPSARSPSALGPPTRGGYLRLSPKAPSRFVMRLLGRRGERG
jgi:hypothetical protein